eukprot:3323859-Pleurochrysis_carterae.AAC.1
MPDRMTTKQTRHLGVPRLPNVPIARFVHEKLLIAHFGTRSQRRTLAATTHGSEGKGRSPSQQAHNEWERGQTCGSPASQHQCLRLTREQAHMQQRPTSQFSIKRRYLFWRFGGGERSVAGHGRSSAPPEGQSCGTVPQGASEKLRENQSGHGMKAASSCCACAQRRARRVGRRRRRPARLRARTRA